jgi:RND family efflux transporter MFP subunit
VTTRRLRWVLPLAVLGLGAAGTLTLLVTRPRVEVEARVSQVPRVRVVEVAPEAVRLTVQTQGTVAPRMETDLVTQVSGKIVGVSPSFVSGGFFDEGDVLVEIDRSDYEAALERARATLVRAESEYERAGKELGRLQSLSERNVASDARVDDAVNAERVAGAALREARAALGQAERDLARTRLRAPFRGRVREKSVGVGEFINRGTPVANLYATDYVEVRLPIPDRQLAVLDLGLLTEPDADADGDRPRGPAVTLSAEFAGAEHTWTGAIHRAEGEIDPRSRMVHVVARVESPYDGTGPEARPPLAVGLFVRAEIEGREVPDAVVLPASALHATAGSGRGEVWVVDAEGRLRPRSVVVLSTRRDDVVIGSGLEAGERVVVSPLGTAFDGMAVRAVAMAGAARPS